MTAYLVCIGAALYLGILTSISPCPLATNIAAIAYIGRKVDRPRLVITAGLLYTAGRCLLYLVLAAVLTTTALAIRPVSAFLQSYAHLVIGPILLLLGMFLVGLITTTLGGAQLSKRLQDRIDGMGVWGALVLGVLFAVSFCPTSATWFFGLVALTMGSEAIEITTELSKIGIHVPAEPVPAGTLVLPTVYGIGTAVPVLLVASMLAYSAQAVGKTYNVLSQVEWWARMVTGWTLIAVGCYMSLTQVFEAF